MADKDKDKEKEDEAIRIASNRALELGYDLSILSVKAIPDSNGWKVVFKPISEPGFVVAGGDITIHINKDNEIYKIVRGQ